MTTQSVEECRCILTLTLQESRWHGFRKKERKVEFSLCPLIAPISVETGNMKCRISKDAILGHLFVDDRSVVVLYKLR